MQRSSGKTLYETQDRGLHIIVLQKKEQRFRSIRHLVQHHSVNLPGIYWFNHHLDTVLFILVHKTWQWRSNVLVSPSLWFLCWAVGSLTWVRWSWDPILPMPWFGMSQCEPRNGTLGDNFKLFCFPINTPCKPMKLLSLGLCPLFSLVA